MFSLPKDPCKITLGTPRPVLLGLVNQISLSVIPDFLKNLKYRKPSHVKKRHISVNLTRKYWCYKVAIAVWPPLFHILAFWKSYSFWPWKLFSRSNSRSKLSENLTFWVFILFWQGRNYAICLPLTHNVATTPLSNFANN